MRRRPVKEDEDVLMYTILPIEEVLEGWDEFEPQYVELRRGNITMLVEPTGFGFVRIVPIISSDAASHLEPRLQPGS